MCPSEYVDIWNEVENYRRDAVSAGFLPRILKSTQFYGVIFTFLLLFVNGDITLPSIFKSR